MKNKKTVYTIVAVSLFVALLHFVIGPGYQGIFKDFIRGYLLDILVPLNLYLLLQLSLRKIMSVGNARLMGASFSFFIGMAVEILQLYGVPVFGRTFDPLDILMYGIGIGLGLVIDLAIINRFEG